MLNLIDLLTVFQDSKKKKKTSNFTENTAERLYIFAPHIGILIKREKQEKREENFPLSENLSTIKFSSFQFSIAENFASFTHNI